MNITVNQNNAAIFSIEANGTELTYQWQLNEIDLNDTANVDLMGVDMETLTIMNAEGSDEGAYRCVITNALGQNVTSDEAFLNVG